MDEHNRQIVREYLIAVEWSAAAARKALDHGDDDGLTEHVSAAAFAARLAEARTARAVMLAAEGKG